MRVLYFGTYERDYPRNAQVISCLRGAGVDVIERHEPVWDEVEHKFSIGARSLARLARAELRLHRRIPLDFDVLLVGYPGHLDLRAARRIARGRPIVFNPLVSLEDTIVGDRGLTSPRSLKARLIRLIDRVAFREADLVVADTEAQARYFSERFDLPDERVDVSFVGAEDRLFTPRQAEPPEALHALFVGKLIPLHGLETIVDAARLCEDVEFKVVGTGQLEGVLSSVPQNVTRIPWVPYHQLPDLYHSAGLALGIFGTSAKAARVIPNKAFQALATGTPLVTADTPAARELLEHDRDALLVPAGDAHALAIAVERLSADRALRKRIGVAGRETYESHASEAVLGRRWRDLLERTNEGRVGAGTA